MGAGTPSTDGAAAAPAGWRLGPLVEGAVALLAIGAILRGLAVAFDNPMTGTFVGAVVVSFAMGRAGVPVASRSSRALRRAGLGAILGTGVIAFAVVAGAPFGARLTAASPSVALVFGTAEALAIAFRDEIWLHGMPLAYAARAGIPPRAAATFAILTPVAAVALEPGATPPGLATVAAASALFVVLWTRSRDGWAPLAAHFTWAWLAGAVLAGELLYLGPPLVHGAGGRGTIAWLAALGFVVAAVAASRIQMPADGADVPAPEAEA